MVADASSGSLGTIVHSLPPPSHPAHQEHRMHRLTALFFISTLSLIAIAVGSQAAQSQTFAVLHVFTGGADGFEPYARPTLDRAGALYGTTTEGIGPGTVFQLKRTNGRWVLNTLFAFSPWRASPPGWSRVRTRRHSIRTTTKEGRETANSDAARSDNLRPPPACGAANCPWTETVLYSFTGGADGSAPYMKNRYSTSRVTSMEPQREVDLPVMVWFSN